MSAKRAASFDVDGTLVDTSYLHLVTWWEAFRQAGRHVLMRESHRAVGLSGCELLDHLLGDGTDRHPEDGGYRDCPPRAGIRLAFIRDAQSAGLTLAEIRSVLALSSPAMRKPPWLPPSTPTPHARYVGQRLAVAGVVELVGERSRPSLKGFLDPVWAESRCLAHPGRGEQVARERGEAVEDREGTRDAAHPAEEAGRRSWARTGPGHRRSSRVRSVHGQDHHPAGGSHHALGARSRPVHRRPARARFAAL
ncbi:hypothetical protein EJ357_04415 [Streptomyces cyaneochromogenes]|uniref:Transcription regulator MerR DNA binding domain-containing protein n=1 Tax=Streptomyces cyaneochromogenes TaxID=2496836 RepID=A0A3S9M0Q9_9ACTN|nr:hypothetical protein EJ357_04415 [Streptomyces cyaneochromogenes]